MEVPYSIIIFISLFFLIVLYRFSRSFLVSTIIVTIGFALSIGFSAMETILISFDRISSMNHLFLSLIIFQVIWLSGQMKETGMMKILVKYLSTRFTAKLSFSMLPAVVGLLPMPGGAIFSAPLVEANDSQKNVPAITKTLINYWFRHIWEYWWPLYPGVILAIEITGMKVTSFMMLLIPFTVFSILTGYIFILRKLPKMEQQKQFHPHEKIKNRFHPFYPIFTIIFIFAFFHIFFPWIPKLNKYIPMAIGLIAAQTTLQIMHPLSWKTLADAAFSRKTLNLLLIVTAIRIYGAFLEPQMMEDQIFNIMDHVNAELNFWGIPKIFIVAAIPFIAGITTGLAIGFVGAGFPVVISLVTADPNQGGLIYYTAIAYGFGYMGMMLSPIHVCLIVTNEFFKTSLSKSLKSLLLPAITMLGFTIIYSFLAKLFMKVQL